jgi:hypothetical protein
MKKLSPPSDLRIEALAKPPGPIPAPTLTPADRAAIAPDSAKMVSPASKKQYARVYDGWQVSLISTSPASALCLIQKFTQSKAIKRNHRREIVKDNSTFRTRGDFSRTTLIAPRRRAFLFSRFT